MSEETDVEQEQVLPYPGPVAPTLAAAGALGNLVALVWYGDLGDPLQVLALPLLWLFASAPYFGIALLARRSPRPTSQLLICLGALLMLAYGSYTLTAGAALAPDARATLILFLLIPLYQTAGLAPLWVLVRYLEKDAIHV